ncbi:FliM/FliN family flagellar motor switch protein [Bacillus cereus]|uniref:FliM/FliN family flagellar motor switch protein n=1 Tax=Bacillus cereus TaxID=1396 RepID=UPI001594E7FA|nr:FliM/FliN family flagellar motor switch protein [Bacillus cereus]
MKPKGVWKMNKNRDPKWLKDIDVNLIVEVGTTVKTIDEILLWRKGTTIKLEDSIVNQLKVYVNNRQFGIGHILRNTDGEMNLRLEKTFVMKGEDELVPKNPDNQ